MSTAFCAALFAGRGAVRRVTSPPGGASCWARKMCSRSSRDDDNSSTNRPGDAAVGAAADTVTPEGAEELLAGASNLPPPPPEFQSDLQDSGWQSYAAWARSQSRHAFRPRGVDPQDTSVVLFPGQGSQFVGMAANLLDFPNVRPMFETAAGVLGYDLLALCLDGPKAALDRTVHCQPAVFVTALAAIERLKAETPQAVENCIATAGFSIGEFAALVFAGVMSFEDGLKVVKVRAEAMQAASEATPSGMMTVYLSKNTKLNFACHTARRYCSEKLDMDDPVCTVANFLYPECKVVAGHREALDFLAQNCRDFGIQRTRPLPVSGAFHTALMRSAVAPLSAVLDDIPLHAPIVPVHANVTAHRHGTSAAGLRRLLTRQLTSPVRWEQTLHVMYARRDGVAFPRTYEAGPGQQLGAMLKRTNLKAHAQYRAIPV